MTRKALAAAAACLALATPALGSGIFEANFAKRSCFARIYDAVHLRAHPRQSVAGIWLSYAPGTADGARNTAQHFALDLGFVLKRGGGRYTGTANCTTARTAFDCALDGDGGSFRVTPRDAGLRFTVVNRGGTDAAQDQINIEGEDFAGFGKPSGDDLVFDLPAAPAQSCNPDGGGH